MHRGLALEEELGTGGVVDGVDAFVDALVLAQLGDVAEGLLPFRGVELAIAAQDRVVALLADDARDQVGEPVAGGPQVLVARGDRDQAAVFQRVARREQLLPGRRRL